MFHKKKNKNKNIETPKKKNEDAFRQYSDLLDKTLSPIQPTNLNSIFSSPEPIFNPADGMSYLNPQESRIPSRSAFSNTPFINAEPSLSNPIYNNPLLPRQTTTFDTTAIKPKKITDELVPSSYKDYLNYYK